ncbi:MAG TPA: plastocyanin/azurin family copper-binding protein [Dehalococcoidia bacterium]|nr:plastocyanin/azurin family copper-binding protein [Dehalococcoidia bacterium]
MRTALLAAALIGALAMTAAMIAGGPIHVRAAQTNIDVGDFYFCDQSFQGGVCETTITAGDTVVWSVSSGTHNVTECDASYTTCPTTGGFVSAALSQGQQFQRIFNAAGTFYYECTFHPQGMKGRVVVQAAQATATPSPTPAPSQTTAPTTAASATPTRTPAAVPATGGDPSGGSAGLPLELALIGGAIAASAGMFMLRSRMPWQN